MRAQFRSRFVFILLSKFELPKLFECITTKLVIGQGHLTEVGYPANGLVFAAVK